MNVKSLQDELTAVFTAAGIDEARTDARELVAFAINKRPVFLRMNPDFDVDPKDVEKIQSFKTRRLNREPVSKITGTKGFWRLDFKDTPDVLSPRPDSETLIDAVLKQIPDKTRPLKILDLGTGTGCLALSLLCEYPNAFAVGFDFSEKALAVATENARLNGLSDRFVTRQGDWTADGWADGFKERFDVVLSNPPYIASSEKESLSPEVTRFDPASALFAGADGLDAYRAIAPSLPDLMTEDAVFVGEFGRGQHEAVCAIVCGDRLSFETFSTDFGGVVRCLTAKRRKKD